MSRDTAYRVFRDDPKHANVTVAIVGAVTEASLDPAWAGFHDAIRDDRRLREHPREAGDQDSARAAAVAALRANFALFRSPGVPVGWLLPAAALTSSPAW